MPPPPPENDARFTQEELESQLDETGSTDSQRSDFISNIVENFAAADADSDGKVSFAEAQAYNESAGQDSATSSQSANSSDAEIMMQIMKLIHAYGSSEQSEDSSLSSLLSVSA